MNTEKLQKAREFEQEQMKKISPEERPSYHVTGSVGWIICSISIIHIPISGGLCTGDI